MQPSANMNPRAELHQSAPSAIARAISNAEAIFPLRADFDPIADTDPNERIVCEASGACEGAFRR